MLFLNSTLDRETPQYSALDFVSAIVSTCNASYGEEDLPPRRREAKNYVTHLLYIEGGDVEVDTVQLNVSSSPSREKVAGLTPLVPAGFGHSARPRRSAERCSTL